MKKWIALGIVTALVIGMVLTSGCVSQSYQVRVIYSGSWSATYFVDDSPATSVFGTGTKIYDVDKPSMMLGIFASKRDGLNEPLTVQILRNGIVIKSAYTDLPMGTVAVTDSRISL
jgi:hypothetical protein